MSSSPGASASPAVDQTEHGRARPVLNPPASLGVIGSGQLGRMFVQAAQRMGYRAGVLSATNDAPAAQVAHWTVIGAADHLAMTHAADGHNHGHDALPVIAASILVDDGTAAKLAHHKD